jgi:hypothetical protein
VRDLLSWCIRFSADDEALPTLTRLGIYFRAPEFAEEAVSACEVVLPACCFTRKLVPQRLRVPISAMFLQLIRNPATQENAIRARVDHMLAEWHRHPSSFGREMDAPSILQNGRFVQRVGELVRSGLLDACGDREALAKFAMWVDCWSPASKERLTDDHRGIVANLRTAG